jgi:hypothetical protein
VSAIGDMVAPVVLITLTTIFSNGLTAVGTGLGRDVLAMERERMSILRGPHGEVLVEGSVPPMDRERLTEIRDFDAAGDRARLAHPQGALTGRGSGPR